MRRVALVLISLFMLSIVPGTAIAQESVWTDLAPATAPSARGIHDMAYDAESDRIVLFGGTVGFESGRLDDTWTYDFNANSWTNRNPGTRPSPQGGHAMAYDAESDRVILFGGDIDGPQTWAYDFNANTWTNRSPIIQPAAWYIHDMAYDAESDRMVLFGGCAGTAYFACDALLSDETWSYDYNGNTWTNMNPGASPTSRMLHRLAYDAESDRIVLFGGEHENVRYDGVTWAYDFNANTWTEMTPAVSPSPRCCYSMAYDATRDRIVLFGGYSPGHRSDTWAYDFDNDTWTQTDSDMRPSARGLARLAYDTESERMIFFGGHIGNPPSIIGKNDTWALVPPPPPPIDWVLVAIVIGVVAAAVVAVVAIALTRRRRRMQEGEGGE